MGFGFPEVVVIFIVALLLFGPKRLPELSRSLGKTVAEFRRASAELRASIEREIQMADAERSVAPPPPSKPENTGPDATKS